MSRRERMAAIVSEIAKLAKRLDGGATFMEVCGTHTVSACRGGVHSLMPENVRLVSGPGCPVCVTAQRYLDALIDLGKWDDVTLATYGDLMRVTGSGGSLERARSEGADVRVVNSTMEAVEIARNEPGREVVFAAVGFETTAPATAAAVKAARREGLANFSVLPCHKLVPPAMEALLADPEIRIEDNLAAVWLEYAFYVGDRLDHCGEDHFQLARTTEGWKIIAIADTQRSSGCSDPPEE